MISLHDIGFFNRNFWVGFLATSFLNSVDEETDLSLTDMMTADGMDDASWWRTFTKYEDGVMEESDGYLEDPEALVCDLPPAQTLKIEFHPGDTVYYINDKRIACTGPHPVIQVIPFKELLKYKEDRQIFLLLLPLAVIDCADQEDAKKIISDALQEIFDKRLCSRYAECIANSLKPE